MFLFIRKFIVRNPVSSKYMSKELYTIDPRCMEKYIDVTAFESRILTLQDEGMIPQEDEETAELFLQGVDVWRGEVPEDVF